MHEVPLKDNGENTFRPVIPIEIRSGNEAIRYEMLVDSGADNHAAVSPNGGAVIWTACEAQLALGKRLYETGTAAKRLRELIAALDLTISNLGATESLKGERESMLLHLAASNLTDHGVPGLEVEYRRGVPRGLAAVLLSRGRRPDRPSQMVLVGVDRTNIGSGPSNLPDSISS